MRNKVKYLASAIANSAAFENFLPLLENAGEVGINFLRVLTYHRIDEPASYPWLDPGLISASPEAFEAQMKYLAANYQPVSVLDVVHALERGVPGSLPPRAAMVTFDDAYSDFKQHAWPILKRFRIPATLFVPTAFPGHPERVFWWDQIFDALHSTVVPTVNTPLGLLTLSTVIERDHAYRQLKEYIKTLPHEAAMATVQRIYTELDVPMRSNIVLDWNSLRELAGEGVILGAHTQTHPIMNQLTVDDLRSEVAGSKEELTREIGCVPLAFAYPSGVYNKNAVKVVEESGFKLAFTTVRGINRMNSAHPLRLQRINVSQRTTLPILRAQLVSWSASIHSLANNLSG